MGGEARGVQLVAISRLTADVAKSGTLDLIDQKTVPEEVEVLVRSLDGNTF